MPRNSRLPSLTDLPDDVLLKIVQEIYVGKEIGGPQDDDGIQNVGMLAFVNIKFHHIVQSFKNITFSKTLPIRAPGLTGIPVSTRLKHEAEMKRLNVATRSLEGVHLVGIQTALGYFPFLQAVEAIAQNCNRIKKLTVVDVKRVPQRVTTFLILFPHLRHLEIHDPQPSSLHDISTVPHLKVLILTNIEERFRSSIALFISEFEGMLDRLEINYNSDYTDVFVNVMILSNHPNSPVQMDVIRLAASYPTCDSLIVTSSWSRHNGNVCKICSDFRKGLHIMKEHYYTNPLCTCFACRPSFEVFLSFPASTTDAVSRSRPPIPNGARAFFSITGFAGEYIRIAEPGSEGSVEFHSTAIRHESVGNTRDTAFFCIISELLSFSDLRSIELSVPMLGFFSQRSEESICRYIGERYRSLRELIFTKHLSAGGSIHHHRWAAMAFNILRRTPYIRLLSINSELGFQLFRENKLLLSISDLKALVCIHLHLIPRRKNLIYYGVKRNGVIYPRVNESCIGPSNQAQPNPRDCSRQPSDGSDPVSIIRLLTGILGALQVNRGIQTLFVHFSSHNVNVTSDERAKLIAALNILEEKIAQVKIGNHWVNLQPVENVFKQYKLMTNEAH